MALKISSVTPSTLKCETGTAITYQVSYTGAASAVHYRIYKNGTEFEVPGWLPQFSYVFTPTTAGEYRLECRLKDANENRSDYKKSVVTTVSGSTVIPVNDDPEEEVVDANVTAKMDKILSILNDEVIPRMDKLQEYMKER